MERETLLALLLVCLGGLTLQGLAGLWTPRQQSDVWRDERACWWTLWWRALPPIAIAAWLLGWALTQPDPVHTHVGSPIFIVIVPVVLVVSRALIRAGWSLWRPTDGFLIATVGLLRPRIVVSPTLHESLDASAMQAALAHEFQHQRHYDPLRIWAAQLMTDLQWPWLPAQRRFDAWLAALETARDDDARAMGIDGADLATAVLTVFRLQAPLEYPAATLIGASAALPARIERLLNPPPERVTRRQLPLALILGAAIVVLVAVVACGALYGERVVNAALSLDF